MLHSPYDGRADMWEINIVAHRNQKFVELSLKLLGESDDQMKTVPSNSGLLSSAWRFFFRSRSVKILEVKNSCSKLRAQVLASNFTICTCTVYIEVAIDHVI